MENITPNKNISSLHIGLDLSLKGTGLTFYLENETTNLRKFKFFILVFDKSISTHYQNVNQIKLQIPKIIDELDLVHESDLIYNNSTAFSKSQIDHTKTFVSVASMVIKKIKDFIIENKINHNELNIHFNMEGSLLQGYDFNAQVALNMLQGLLRGDLIKLHLTNNFNQIKFRIIPAKALKLFFTGDGSADKPKMMSSFINNYNGKKLIPQANTDNKTVVKLNDIIDGFALIAYNIYDLRLGTLPKLLFNKTVIKDPTKPKVKRKPRQTKLTISTNKNLPKLTSDFFDNTDSKILKDNNIL